MTFSIWDFSKTPASNNQATPQGWPEGQLPSTVNDCARQLIAMTFEGLAVSTLAGGTADALTVTFTNIPTAPSTLVDGMEIKVRAASANATATPTLAVNGGTARTITKQGGTALDPGNIPGALAECVLRYNLANTRWELLNPAPSTGTWTPVVTFATPGDLAVVYNAQVGSYTKIGRLVTISCTISTTTFTYTTASGNLQVTGLPFAAKTVTNYFAVASLLHGGLTVTGAIGTNIRVTSGASIAIPTISAGGPSSISTLTTGNTTSGSGVVLEFTMQYEAAS